MKTAQTFALVTALAAMAFVQACAPEIHSGLCDTDTKNGICEGTTSIELPAYRHMAEASGTVWLAAGSATVVFRGPGENSKTWEYRYNEGSAGTQEFLVGPCSMDWGTGSYSLEIVGSGSALGGYDLSLDAYPR